MQQENFLIFEDFISGHYTNHSFSSDGSCFCDILWLNFGWGKEVTPVTGKLALVHHPDEVWMHCTLSDGEPWKKVKILKERPGTVPLTLVTKPAKVRDLKTMAREHIPSPQCNFYSEMPDQVEDGDETEHEDND